MAGQQKKTAEKGKQLNGVQIGEINAGKFDEWALAGETHYSPSDYFEKFLNKQTGKLNRTTIANHLNFDRKTFQKNNSRAKQRLEELEEWLCMKNILSPLTEDTVSSSGNECPTVEYNKQTTNNDKQLIAMLQSENERLRIQLKQDFLHSRCLITLGELLDDQ